VLVVSGSVSSVPVTAPAPVTGVAHWAALVATVVPTALEHTRTETLLVVAPPSPMLAIAKLDTVAALGSAVCAVDEVPWTAYSTAFRAAEFSDVATRKKYPKSTA